MTYICCYVIYLNTYISLTIKHKANWQHPSPLSLTDISSEKLCTEGLEDMKSLSPGHKKALCSSLVVITPHRLELKEAI